MKKIWIVLIISALLLPFLPTVSTAQPDVRVMFQIKYLEFDKNWNSYKMLVNISVNKPGHLTYIEEYYTVDGNRNPKLSSSNRYDAGELVKEDSSYNASFEILRPVPRGGKTYSLIKAVVLFDDMRVLEYWLTRNKDFVDNTGTDDSDDTLLAEIQNVDRHETSDGTLIAGSPVTFEYSSLDVIYEINATGKANGEVSLRVELLKGRSGNTDKPKGAVYKYIDMSADSNKVGEIAAKYRIENSWMKNRSIPERNVGMVSWDGTDKKWIPMPTKILDKDDSYTYFESVAPGLSSFAIIGFPVPKKSSSTATKTPNVNASGKGYPPNDADNNGSKEPLIKNIPGFGFILTMVAFLLIFKRIKKDSKIENRKQEDLYENIK